ncbi:MAG: c-type heme family protein, partial [Burkholderiales bacterium]
PDKAVAEACVTCHNNHKDSPRSDFKLNDIMGGIVIRIPLTGG